MGIKKTLHAMVLATAVLGANGAKAQSAPVDSITINTASQTNNVLDPRNNVKNDPTLGKQFLATNLRYGEKFGNINMGIVGDYDSAFGGGATLDASWIGDSVAVGGLYKKLQYAQYSLIAGSANFSNLNLSGSYSTGSQSAAKALGNDQYGGNLTGNKSTLSLTLQEYGILENLGFQLVHAKTHETNLKTQKEITVETSTLDLGDMIQTITRKYSNNTYTNWSGGTTNSIQAVGGIRLDDKHRLDLSVGRQVQSIMDEKTSYTVSGINYTYIHSRDSKFKFGYSNSGQSQQANIEYGQLFDNGQGELVIGVNNTKFSNGIPSSNNVYAGVRYSFGGKSSGYTHNSTRANSVGDRLRETMNQNNQANPRSIGRVYEKTEKILDSETSTYTPKEIPTSFGKLLVNADGTITVEFGSAQAKALQASALGVPTSNKTYSVELTKQDGKIETINVAPPSWTSSVLGTGKYSIVLITKNTVEGKTVESRSESKSFTIEQDNKEEISELEVQAIGYVDATFKYQRKDDDGIRNEAWKFAEQTTAQISVNQETQVISITHATPGSKITLVYSGEYAIKGTDGKLTWKEFKKTKEITFLSATDSPTVLGKPQITVTYNSVSVKNMITDLNGVSNQYAELYDEAGNIVGAKQTGISYTWNNLKSNYSYTVKTYATVIKLNSNNTTSEVVVDVSDTATTKEAGVDAPTTIVLTANNVTTNSVLAACNIIDTNGATGTCTLSRGGIVIKTWNIGSNETITGLDEDTAYELRVVGTAIKINEDHTTTNQAIDEKVNFTTKLTPDTTPNAFSFADQTNVAVGSTVTSAPITIAGINTASAISVTGGEYSINGGAWTSTAGTVTNGQSVRLRVVASGSNSATTSATLTVGGVSDSFDVTTEAAPLDPIPNAFSFADQTNVAVGSTVTSAPITIAGINTASAISVTGGEYSINGGAWTSTAGTVTNGQSVRLRVVASGSNSATTSATLTVGGVSDSFDVTTEAPALPSCTTSMPKPAASWSTGSVGNINISNCTAGATWTVEDITTGGPVVTWQSATSGSGDVILGYDVNGFTEGKVFKVRITVSKGGQNQVYELTATNPIF